jgi:hypothetical protein
MSVSFRGEIWRDLATLGNTNPILRLKFEIIFATWLMARFGNIWQLWATGF